MKLNSILAAGLLLLTACSGDDVAEEIVSPTTVNVISCKITSDESSQTGDLTWKKRRTAVVSMVKAQSPDVFCTQGQYWNQVIYLGQQLDEYDYVDYNGDGNSSVTGYHNTVMYKKDKYTLVKSGRFWLSQKPTSMTYPWSSTDLVYRTAVWTLLKDNSTNAKFYVVSTEFNDGDETEDIDARLSSSNLLISQLKSIMDGDDLPYIIAGELKASIDSDCLAPLYKNLISARESAKSSSSTESFNGFGDNTAASVLNSDHIFISEGSVEIFKTILDEYDVKYMSEYYPIYSKIKLYE